MLAQDLPPDIHFSRTPNGGHPHLRVAGPTSRNEDLTV